MILNLEYFYLQDNLILHEKSVVNLKEILHNLNKISVNF